MQTKERDLSQVEAVRLYKQLSEVEGPLGDAPFESLKLGVHATYRLGRTTRIPHGKADMAISAIIVARRQGREMSLG